MLYIDGHWGSTNVPTAIDLLCHAYEDDDTIFRFTIWKTNTLEDRDIDTPFRTNAKRNVKLGNSNDC
jgi:hypothetical protein